MINEIEIMLSKDSAEAEINLLGSLLTENSLIYELKVKEIDLENKTSKSILNAMLELEKDQQEINVISVYEKLKGKITLSKLNEIAENGYIYKNAFSSIQNAVLKNSAKRKCLEISEYINKSLVNNVDPTEIFGEVNKFLSNSDNSLEKEIINIRKVMAEAVDEIVDSYTNGGILSGMQTEHYLLDNILNGIEKKKYYVIGARPGVGKTAFSLELTRRLSYKNKGLFFSVEMTRQELAKRLLSNLSNVNGYKINSGQITEEEFERINNRARRLANYKLDVVDNGGMTIEEVCRIATLTKNRKGLDFIIVDYIQLLKTEDKRAITDKMTMDIVSGKLRELSKKLDIAVIALAQLNRGAAGKIPKISDLKESGAIEQDANVILLLHSDDEPTIYADGSERLDVIIGKNRSGQSKKTVVFKYYKSTQKIEEAGTIEDTIDE